jgi:hypothetical protein
MGNRSLSRRAVITALAGAVAACALAGSITARAQGPKPRVDVMVLLAKQDPKGGKIDPRVAKLPQIAQPPFNAYNTWSLLDQKALTLDQAKPADPWKGKPMATYALPNGKTLEIALLDALSGGRFQIGTSISQGVSPDLIKYNAPAGEPVFIAGQGYKDGILVVGITLLP